MTSTNPTGPVALGRWQQPAAQIQAGLVPPDPYPLEKILYCATCNQPLFGAHQTNGNPVTGDARVYRTFCDHRPGPISAGEVELRVYAETHVHGFGTDMVTGLTSAHYALLVIRFFTRIEVGPTADHLTFTARI